MRSGSGPAWAVPFALAAVVEEAESTQKSWQEIEEILAGKEGRCQTDCQEGGRRYSSLRQI
jgi:hypothetical protein